MNKSYLERVLERLELDNGRDIQFLYSEEVILKNMKYIDWCDKFGLSPYKCLTFLEDYIEGDYVIDDKIELTNDELIHCYNIVWDSPHSDGFKSSEAKDLIFGKDFWFIHKPKYGWLDNLKIYLNNIGFNLSLTKLEKWEK